MAATKKTLLKEISNWKKRLNTSKKVINDVYKDVSKDAKKLYKDTVK